MVGFGRFVFALFLHPKLCFVGFWLAATAMLMGSVGGLEHFGIWDAPLDEPPWWFLTTLLGVPLVLTVVLRRYVPRIMKALLVVIGVMFAIVIVVSIVDHLVAG